MKGVVFTFDAMFALLLTAAIIPVIIILAPSPELSGGGATLSAESAIDALTQMSVRNVIREPVIQDLYAQGILDGDIDRPLIELIISMWASNDTINITRASNITEKILGRMLPGNVKWALALEDDVLYDTGGTITKTSFTGRKIASGFMKGEESSGFVASLFLTSIGGKRASSYYFFGGFVGQGNISFLMDGIPADANVTEIHMEASAGSNFTFYVNGNSCGTHNATSDPMNVTLNGTCTGHVIPGGQNLFNITFTDRNTTTNFFGGGSVRITYTTEELLSAPASTRYNLPGVDGIINQFSSVYANGNITSMEMRLHFLNNFTTFVNIGNVTVFNSSGSDAEQTVQIDNSTLGGLLDYAKLGAKTIPLRIGVEIPNITDIQEGNADVVLITDISGSMSSRLNDSAAGVQRDCDDPMINDSSTSRLSLAKCLDKEFVNIILGTDGNRVALVSYSFNAANTSLTTDNNSLHAAIDVYSAGGFTCICCAERAARKILEDQSNSSQKKFIIVMTDGIANMRCDTASLERTTCCSSLFCSSPWCGISLESVPECGDTKDDTAIINAIDDSCAAHSSTGATVHSIGFGPIATCAAASTTLQSISNCGNGTFFASNDTEELKNIYDNLAQSILLQTFSKQTSIITGNASSIFYPDSYIELNYTNIVQPAPYQEISINAESNVFTCSNTLFIPQQLRPESARVTSFSGDLWTSNVSLNTNKTGNEWKEVFLLSSYGPNFRALGDPFVIDFSPELLKQNNSNMIQVYLGESALNSSAACPASSRIVYGARLRASVPYGNVFPELKGGVVRVYYDIDHDGTSDGFTDVTVGAGLPDFDPSVRTTDQLSAGNALDDAFLRLMGVLNFVPGTGFPGSTTNPIDVRLSDINVDVTGTGGIPFAWGPIDVRLDVKI